VYLCLHDSPFQKKAIDIIEKLYLDQYVLYTSPLALDEHIHAIKRTIQKEKLQSIYPTLHAVLESILDLTGLSLINSPTDLASQFHILTYMKDYSLKTRDAYHLLIMKYHDISHFATFDEDFEKVFADGMMEKY